MVSKDTQIGDKREDGGCSGVKSDGKVMSHREFAESKYANLVTYVRENLEDGCMLRSQIVQFGDMSFDAFIARVADTCVEFVNDEVYYVRSLISTLGDNPDNYDECHIIKVARYIHFFNLYVKKHITKS